LRKQEVSQVKSYRYSDINFNVLQEILEANSNTPLNHYVDDFFYRPMGLFRTCYLPMQRLPLSGIVPTEEDKFWRNQLVHGTVHDPAAAIYGGVAGSAGVFSNANELAVIFQMLLNHGEYAGKQYLNPGTIDRFTQSQPGTHRGLGFNKATGSEIGPCSSLASKNTFGHRGFTGTCVWADPKQDLIYIFLSNRVYPNDDNTKLRSKQVRERIHSVIYESLMAGPV
jgi:CubicO group peptidase (beta-lactamase class C family)